mgnify:CR=1 FL=1
MSDPTRRLHSSQGFTLIEVMVALTIFATGMLALAQRLCEGRIVVALEGGYDTRALAWCASGLVEVLLGDAPTPDPEPGDVPPGDDLPALIAHARRLAGL